MLESAAVMHIDPAFSASYPFAFILGLVSSLHCLTMCSSIIGTLTLSLGEDIRQQRGRLLSFVLSYNLGRIGSYVLAGLLAGLLHVVLLLPFDASTGGGHRWLQLVSALFMAGAGLYIAGWFPRFAYIEKAGASLWRHIEPLGRRLLPVTTLPQAFLFGTIWGWLPCGLVYAALLVAAGTGDVSRSALTMLAFGLGTLPAVLGAGIMANLLTRLARSRGFRRSAGLVMLLIALFSLLPEGTDMHHMHSLPSD